jgi:hypothetical protein
MFPSPEDQHLHLSSSIYTKGIFNRSLGERVIQFCPFVRKGSTLNIVTTLRGSHLNASVRYSDNCIQPPCPHFNDGEDHDFVFDDPQHTLRWGLVGFTSAEGNPETDIQNLELVSADSKANDN